MKTIKTFKEIKDYFRMNPSETKKLKEDCAKRYNDDNYLERESEEFLNGYFYDSSLYELKGYIQVKQKLIKTLENKIIYMNGLPYTEISIYNNTESNLKLYSVSFDNKTKDFHTKGEAFKEVENFGKVLSNYKGFTKRNKAYDKYPTQRKETKDNFYGNYKENGKEYCEIDIHEMPSNFDLWTIRISGNDDYSISKDYLTKKDMLKDKKIIDEMEVLEKDKLEDFYFSN